MQVLMWDLKHYENLQRDESNVKKGNRKGPCHDHRLRYLQMIHIRCRFK